MGPASGHVGSIGGFVAPCRWAGQWRRRGRWSIARHGRPRNRVFARGARSGSDAAVQALRGPRGRRSSGGGGFGKGRGAKPRGRGDVSGSRGALRSAALGGRAGHFGALPQEGRRARQGRGVRGRRVRPGRPSVKARCYGDSCSCSCTWNVGCVDVGGSVRPGEAPWLIHRNIEPP